ncbi:MAG: site-specific integrase [Bryobacterales bacterium]|nr:site-specific integrase [Bryobacterales bacterium]
MLRPRNGKWHYRFQLKHREYAGSTGYEATEEHRGAAEAMEAEVRRQLSAGLTADMIDGPPAIQFGFAARRYLEWAQSEYRRPTTYDRIVDSFVPLQRTFEGKLVCSIDAADLEWFKVERLRTVKPVTVRHDLHALSGFFRFAMRLGWTARNPVLEIKVPSDRDAIRIHPLTDDEESAYLRAARTRPRLYDLSRLMLGTGMRPDEILSLRAADVQRSVPSVTVQHGKSRAARRTIRLVGDCSEILCRLSDGRRSTEYLFPGRKKGAHASPMNGTHTAACIDAGVRFRLYDLRHTFATRMAAKGMPLTTLAAILGHSNLRCVMRYVHPTQAQMDQAMAAYAAA